MDKALLLLLVAGLGYIALVLRQKYYRQIPVDLIFSIVVAVILAISFAVYHVFIKK